MSLGLLLGGDGCYWLFSAYKNCMDYGSLTFWSVSLGSRHISGRLCSHEKNRSNPIGDFLPFQKWRVCHTCPFHGSLSLTTPGSSKMGDLFPQQWLPCPQRSWKGHCLFRQSPLQPPDWSSGQQIITPVGFVKIPFPAASPLSFRCWLRFVCKNNCFEIY